VIIAGRNIYPPELEEAVAGVPGIRKGNVVVFGSPDRAPGTERLVILAETRETDPETLSRLRSEINRLSANLVGAPPNDLVFAPPGTIPKTSSGKLRRAAARELFEQGLLGRASSGWRQVLRLAFFSLSGQLRRSRRVLAKGAYAAYAWGLYYLLVTPAFLGVMLLPRLSWRWSLIRCALWCLRRASGISLAVQGLEQIPADRPCILIANHASYLDAYVLSAVLPPPVRFTAKAELAAHPLLRRALQRIGTEFVERFDRHKGVEDVRRLAQLAKEGRSLVFFPEGTFTRVPGLRPFHMGAFLTAAKANLPVVPIAIRGTRSILRADFWFPQRGSISVQVGPPIDPVAMPGTESGSSDWDKALRLSSLSREHILRFCGEPDLGEGPSGR